MPRADTHSRSRDLTAVFTPAQHIALGWKVWITKMTEGCCSNLDVCLGRVASSTRLRSSNGSANNMAWGRSQAESGTEAPSRALGAGRRERECNDGLAGRGGFLDGDDDTGLSRRPVIGHAESAEHHGASGKSDQAFHLEQGPISSLRTLFDSRDNLLL